MRESQYKILREKLQSKLDHAARTIQRWVRAKLDRKRFLQIKKAAITIQVRISSFVFEKCFFHASQVYSTKGNNVFVIFPILHFHARNFRDKRNESS